MAPANNPSRTDASGDSDEGKTPADAPADLPTGQLSPAQVAILIAVLVVSVAYFAVIVV